MDFDSLRDVVQRTVLSLPHGPRGRGKLLLPGQGANTSNSDCEPDFVAVSGMDLVVIQAKSIVAARGSQAEVTRFTEHFLAEASRQAEKGADLQDGLSASIVLASSTLEVGCDLTGVLAMALSKPTSTRSREQLVGRGLRAFIGGNALRRRDDQNRQHVDLSPLNSKLFSKPPSNAAPGADHQRWRRQVESGYLLLRSRSAGVSLFDSKAALWQRQLESAYLLVRNRRAESARLLLPGYIVAGPSGFGNSSETDRLATACGLTRLSVALIPRPPSTAASGAGAPGRAARERAAWNSRGHRFSLAA
ncbi:hypothetical protein [Kitasatospora cheerisanensis]|uniref:Uncharacterized protein n=1 Tax=Kitasatospora cheerisanensis KCTC 2395 TaxID=1348663 RepID=A0A066YWK4_9ACTN|nr:hypothetical protein [Kitasatospora cheerisanensis]KDN85607.1 hypothetical protein KCH_26240 [Kitasatospora cheerisanensis KCTC 2395]